MCVDLVYRACSVMFMGYKTLADFIILDIKEFDIILGITWLSPDYSILDYYGKIITIMILGMEKL